MTPYERALALVAREPELCDAIVSILEKRHSKQAVRRGHALTRSMQALYDFIRDYGIANDGVCPSYDEMKEHLGLHSKSGIHRLVSALEERGRIRRLPNRARSIVVNEPILIRASQA